MSGLKQLNIYFSEEEFEHLQKIKSKLDLSWHDLVLKIADKKVMDIIDKK
jgi:hypothetical protein